MSTVNFQRRHFEAIAEVVNILGRGNTLVRPYSTLSHDDHAMLARAFVAKLKPTNPNFNSDRFLKACGVEG